MHSNNLPVQLWFYSASLLVRCSSHCASQVVRGCLGLFTVANWFTPDAVKRARLAWMHTRLQPFKRVVLLTVTSVSVLSPWGVCAYWTGRRSLILQLHLTFLCCSAVYFSGLFAAPTWDAPHCVWCTLEWRRHVSRMGSLTAVEVQIDSACFFLLSIPVGLPLVSTIM